MYPSLSSPLPTHASQAAALQPRELSAEPTSPRSPRPYRSDSPLDWGSPCATPTETGFSPRPYDDLDDLFEGLDADLPPSREASVAPLHPGYVSDFEVASPGSEPARSPVSPRARSATPGPMRPQAAALRSMSPVLMALALPVPHAGPDLGVTAATRETASSPFASPSPEPESRASSLPAGTMSDSPAPLAATGPALAERRRPRPHAVLAMLRVGASLAALGGAVWLSRPKGASLAAGESWQAAAGHARGVLSQATRQTVAWLASAPNNGTGPNHWPLLAQTQTATTDLAHALCEQVAKACGAVAARGAGIGRPLL